MDGEKNKKECDEHVTIMDSERLAKISTVNASTRRSPGHTKRKVKLFDRWLKQAKSSVRSTQRRKSRDMVYQTIKHESKMSEILTLKLK